MAVTDSSFNKPLQTVRPGSSKEAESLRKRSLMKPFQPEPKILQSPWLQIITVDTVGTRYPLHM